MSNIYSVQTNSEILTSNFLKFTVFKNSEEIYDPVGREFYVELDLHRMTFSYRKTTEKDFERIFGYKQIYKYSLKLSHEEKSLARSDYPVGFKLFLENRVFILFCKSMFDYKIWVRGLKTFFDKKFIVVMDMNKQTKNDNLKYSSLFKNKNSNRNEFESGMNSNIFGSEESFMSKLRDPKKFKIYVQTILTKQSVKITNKIFENYLAGLKELNLIFKDFLNMKFVMKMKSEMDQEKIEEEKILAKDDYKTPKDKLINSNNLNTPKGNFFKSEIYSKAQPRKSFNSNKESNKESENSLHSSLNKNNENNFSNLKILSVNQIQINVNDTALDRNDKYKRSRTISDNQLKPALNKKEIPGRGNNNMTKKLFDPLEENNYNNPKDNMDIGNEIPNNMKKLNYLNDSNKYNQPHPGQYQDNGKINNNNNDTVDYIPTTFTKKPEVYQHELPGRSPRNENFNNTPINLKSKILDQANRPSELNTGKKDNETIQSTCVTPTENSENDLNNSRRTDPKIVNNNEHTNYNNLSNPGNLYYPPKNNEKKDKTYPKILNDIITDDLTDFPDLRLPSQKKENMANTDNRNPKKENDNAVKISDVNIPSFSELNDKVPKTNNGLKKLIKDHPDSDYAPYDRKDMMPENKKNKIMEDLTPNAEKKIPLFTLIDTPNYGTVSFIAQRFEKIELDLWRDD